MRRGHRILSIAGVATAVGVASVVLIPSPQKQRPLEPLCTWLAGDLDAHTAYSATSVRKISFEEALTFALSVEEQMALARERGLDFLAITDYEDNSAASDPAYGGEGLIWIPGYEHQFEGVAQMLGATRIYEGAGAAVEEVREVVDQLHDEGGLLQVAQPGDGAWQRAYGTQIEPDAVEVWFNGPWAYDPGEIGKDGAESIAFYDRLLDEGFEVTVTAGSHSFRRGVTKLAGVGQPTTWVCADELSAAGILAAIDAGRTSVSHEYPTQGPLTEGENAPSPQPQVGGDRSPVGFRNPPPSDTEVAFVSMEVDVPGGLRYEGLSGDVAGVGDPIRVGVFNAPFSVLRIVTDDSRVLDEIEVFSPSFVHEFAPPEGVSWVRAEVYSRPETTAGGPCQLNPTVATYCENRLGMLALASPIFVREGAASSSPPTSPSPGD